jgi:hypothetical protein
MHRRRAASPRGTLKIGKIVAGGKLVAICALHDMSTGGACLSVLGASQIPEMFDLVLEAQGLTRSCRVAWKVDDTFGVCFTHASTAASAGATLAGGMSEPDCMHMGPKPLSLSLLGGAEPRGHPAGSAS